MGVYYANAGQKPKVDRDEMYFCFDKCRRIFNRFVWPYLTTPSSDTEVKEIRRYHAMHAINDFIIEHQDGPGRCLGFALKNMMEGDWNVK